MTRFEELLDVHRTIVDEYAGPVDEIGLLTSAWSAASDTTRQVRGSDASVPELTLASDPTSAGSQVVAALYDLVSRNPGIDSNLVNLSAATGMVLSLKDVDAYVGPPAADLSDLGVSVFWQPGYAGGLVFEVVRGSPGALAGIRTGQFLPGLYGPTTAGRPSTDFHLPGIEGYRGVDTFDFTFRPPGLRAMSNPPDYAVRLLSDGIAYVRLYRIPSRSQAVASLEEDLKALASQGPRAWILDLRENFGGPVDRMADIAALLGYTGPLAELTPRQGPATWVLAPRKDSVRATKDLAVIFDYNTRGAALLLMVALREANLAYVVGQRFYGDVFVTQQFLTGSFVYTIPVAKVAVGPDRALVERRRPDFSVVLDTPPLRNGIDSQIQGTRDALRRLIEQREPR